MTKDRQNWKRAWCYFVGAGEIPVDTKKNEWCLHHVDATLKYTDPERYNEWRVEDLQPMLKAEHTRMHCKGRPLSKETRRKLSLANKGKRLSEETRRKISANNGSRRPDVRAKISEANKGKPAWNKGRAGCYSEEALKKMGAANKGRVQSEEERTKRAKSAAEAWKDEKLLEKQSRRVSSSVWINDGEVSRRIGKDMEIPAGWSRGRLGFIRKVNPKLGPMSASHKLKISKARKGCVFTEEHKRRLSEARKKTNTITGD